MDCAKHGGHVRRMSRWCVHNHYHKEDGNMYKYQLLTHIKIYCDVTSLNHGSLVIHAIYRYIQTNNMHALNDRSFGGDWPCANIPCPKSVFVCKRDRPSMFDFVGSVFAAVGMSCSSSPHHAIHFASVYNMTSHNHIVRPIPSHCTPSNSMAPLYIRSHGSI